MFPFPLQNHAKSEFNKTACTSFDDVLYFLERWNGLDILDNFVDITIKRPEFIILDKTYTLKPAENILKIFIKMVEEITRFDLFEYGCWVAIRNGNEFSQGAILGFIQFQCDKRDDVNKIKEYLKKNNNFLHSQIVDAFYEGTIFEIEQELGDLTSKKLSALTNDFLPRIMIPVNEKNKNRISLDYKTDIPYDLREAIIPTLQELKDSIDNIVIHCGGPCIKEKNKCDKNDCKDYQKKNVLRLILRIAQIKGIKEKILKHGTKAAMTAIMARNFSHNIGSHVLSTVTEEYLKDNLQQVSNFHTYLQKRMDLIARIVGGQYAAGEPMFFIGDVLNGFFNQDLLLNHLVKDQGGYEKGKIKFIVCLPDSDPVTFEYEDTKWITSDDSYNDFLISIPDGEIGCQAFYLFFESMMRNSAKYGLNKNPNDDDFIITLTLVDKEDYYKISICDNRSLCDGNLTENIRNKIKEPIVDGSGQLVTKNFGIAEMREACRFLMEPFGANYPAWKDKNTNNKFPLWVDCPRIKSLDMKPPNCCENLYCNQLTYTFNLMKPQMVAIVGNNDILDNGKYGIKNINLNDLKSQKAAYQFVLIYVNKENKDNIINCLKKYHHLLPFRLLLVGNNISLPDELPKRRVITCTPEEIHTKDIDKDNGAEQFIISIYEAWIRNRWLMDRCCNFVLAFERKDGHSIFNKYEKIKSIKLLSDKVNWFVYRTYYENGFQADEPPKQQQNNNHNNCYYFVYDNHSSYVKAKKLLNTKNVHFHHITGNKNKKIFEALESPPNQKDFTFAYFLLGFLEAALTKIIIIDERVAESCIGDEPYYRIDHLITLDKCLCYPLFYAEDKPLNDHVKQKIHKLDEEKKMKLWRLSLESSKLHIANNDDKRVEDADFVVVHYGLIETVEALKKVKSLYSLAPSVVITSGRGAGTIKKDETIQNFPFLETSILKDNTYPSISKYHLTRALMSVKGGV